MYGVKSEEAWASTPPGSDTPGTILAATVIILVTVVAFFTLLKGIY